MLSHIFIIYTVLHERYTFSIVYHELSIIHNNGVELHNIIKNNGQSKFQYVMNYRLQSLLVNSSKSRVLKKATLVEW
jgi:hypothetical protein